MIRSNRPRSQSTSALQTLILCLGALSLLLVVPTTSSAEITTYTIQIDSSTTQPVGTGFTPTVTGDYFLIFAEGAIRPFSASSWVGGGWFGPDGQTRLARGGQIIFDGMPYGALIGGPASLGSTFFQFHGSRGASVTSPVDVGSEYEIALNMSDTDLANMDGSINVTLVHIPAGEATVVETILDSNSGDVVGTGIIAEQGDTFMILAYGTGRFGAANPLSGSWFTPSGLIGFNRVGQPYSAGPYGGLYGSFNGGSTGFFVGEEGSWTGQPADDGDELSYLLNMSASDAAGMEGRIIVRTIHIPSVVSAIEEPAEGAARTLRSFPNPMSESLEIQFSLPSTDSIRLRIYDTSGRWIRNLVHDSFAAGRHTAEWDGRADTGEKVKSGTYFYQLSTSVGSKTGRIVVQR